MGRHRDMRQHCDLQTVASSGAVVTCVAGTCAPAPRSTTLEVTAPGTCHCVCVCVRRGQDFNRWSSSCEACEAETCGARQKQYHQYPYLYCYLLNLLDVMTIWG